MKTENLIRLLAEDLPSRSDHPGRALTRWLLATAGLTGAAFLMLAGVRSDLFGSGLIPALMKLLLGILLAWSALVGARTLARPEATLGQGVRRLGAIAVFLTVLLAFDLIIRGIDGWHMRLFGKGIVACLTLIPALALLPLVASLYAFREGATTSPAATGGLVGLASAGLAIIAYGSFCTEDSPVFVATWYSLAAILVAGFGSVLGRALLRW